MLIAFEWFRIVFSLFHHRRIKGWHFHWKAWLNIFDIKRKQTDGFGTNIWRNVIKCKHAAEEDLKGNIDRDHHLECLFPILADAFETFLSGCLWSCKRPNYGVVILVTVKPDAFWLRGTGKNTGSGLSRNIKQFWRRHDRVNCWMNLSNSG